MVFICKGSQALPECCPTASLHPLHLGTGTRRRRAGAGAAQALPLVCLPPCEHNIRSNALPASLPSAPTFLCCCRQLGQRDGRLPQLGHRALKIPVALEVLEFILLVLRLRGVSGQPIRDCPPYLLGLAPLPGVVRGPVSTATCSCDQRHATHPGELRCPHSRGVTGSALSCSCDAVRLYGKWGTCRGLGRGPSPHDVPCHVADRPL